MTTAIAKLSALDALVIGNGEPRLKALVPEFDGEVDLCSYAVWYRTVMARVYTVPCAELNTDAGEILW
jgi:hypothetical protein